MSDTLWPSLPYPSWKNTLDTLHMYMQIVGKVKLLLCSFRNQWWEVAFYVTPRGITTGRIPYKNKAFAVDFDFIHHEVSIYANTGKSVTIPLTPTPVAVFYKEFFNILQTLGISANIYPTPVEFVNPIPFKKDTKHKSYDREFVTRWWNIVLQTSFVMDKFQSTFRGKSSPIHFFWGSFDIAATRFSGKMATPPKLKGVMDKIMKLSENEENFTFGFWPGDKKFQRPAFYSYIYPVPNGYERVKMGSATAYFDKKLSLCILPYEELRKLKNPEKEILNFLAATYKEYAKLAGWDVKTLEIQPSTFRKGEQE